MKILKEGGLKMGLIKYLMPVMILLLGCSVNKKFTSVSNPLYLHTPISLKYDTLDAIFFYENLISSYQEADAIVKSGGFIKANTITKESYYNGYYIGNAYSYVKHLSQKGIVVRYDDVSIGGFQDSLFQKGLVDGSYEVKLILTRSAVLIIRSFN